jgi:hypothetical protein
MERTDRENFRTFVTKTIFVPKRMGKVKVSQQRAVYQVYFFNFSTEWAWKINAIPHLLYTWEVDPFSHFTGGWVGLGAGQDGYGQSSPPPSHRGLNPDRPARERVAIPTALSRPPLREWGMESVA